MLVCSACTRHVRVRDRQCPFCGAGLQTTRPLVSISGLVLGLALAGCGDKDDGDEGASMSAGTASDETTASETSQDSTTGGDSTTDILTGEAVAAYGDPGTSTFDPDTGTTGPNTSSTGSDSSGDSGSSSDTGTTAGTDTSTTSG